MFCNVSKIVVLNIMGLVLKLFRNLKCYSYLKQWPNRTTTDLRKFLKIGDLFRKKKILKN